MMLWWNSFKLPSTFKDMPTWGQRDYRLYPPRYGDIFIEEEEEVEVEEEEEEIG